VPHTRPRSLDQQARTPSGHGMTSVANSIGIRSHGIAGATLATLELARARIFFLVRLGFPSFVDEADKFAFCAGASFVTVRLASGDEGSTLARLNARTSLDRGNRTLVSERRGAAHRVDGRGVEHTSARRASRPSRFAIATVPGGNCVWDG
jgi:hypothetical protein